MTDAEAQFRDAMRWAEARGEYGQAALAALGYAEVVSARTAEGGMFLVAKVQVYAALHHAKVVECQWPIQR